MKGATPAFASPRMHAIFSAIQNAKSSAERQHIRQSRKLTQQDDMFCFAGTALDMYAQTLQKLADLSMKAAEAF